MDIIDSNITKISFNVSGKSKQGGIKNETLWKRGGTECH